MPDQPEREIEKTLRAYAKQRQADPGAPRELHPATRRALQAEAARTHAPKRRGRGLWSRWFRISLPQLTVGLGTIVVIGVTSAILFTKSQPQKKVAYQMALAPVGDVPTAGYRVTKEESRSQAATPPPVSPAPVTMADANRSKDSTLKKNLTVAQNGAETGLPGSDQEVNQPVSPPTGHVASAKTEIASRLANVTTNATPPTDKDRLLAQDKLDTTFAAPSVPPIAVVTNHIDLTATDRLDVNGMPASKKFIKTDRPMRASGTSKSLAMSGVFDSFQVEVTGNNIRIVDSDGSVYAGQLLPPDQTDGRSSLLADESKTAREEIMTRRRVLVAETPAPAAQPAKPQATGGASAQKAALQPITANYFFRVTGTNLSLHLPVVFNGSFAGAAISTPANPPGFGAIGGKISTNTLGLLQWTNLYISGHATIGTNQVDISAKAADGR